MHKGFTLLELILVIVLIGILSAVAAPRFFSSSDYLQVATRDHLIQTLQQAQLLSMDRSDDCAVVHFSDQSVWIPDSSASCSVSSSGESMYSFDIWGRPSSLAQVRISIPGNQVMSVCIEPEGYIHACSS